MSTRSSVRCYICNELKVSEKYRRHLNLHVKNGEITQSVLEEIVFQSKFTRKDCMTKHGICIGNLCTFCVGESICGVYVKDLRTHLIRTHKLSPTNKEFVLALDNTTTCAKTLSFFVPNIHRRIFNEIDVSKFGLLPTSSHFVPNSTLDHNSDSNDDEDVVLSNNEEEAAVDKSNKLEVQLLKSKYPLFTHKLLVMINCFDRFLRSKWGGSRKESSCKVVVSSLLKLIRIIREENIWNPGFINRFFSKESHRISPATLLSRLQAFGHFIYYLKIDFPDVLPSSRKLLKIESMISGVKTSLCKERNSRNRSLMQKTRRNFTTSLQCLKEWRSKRDSSNIQAIAQINDFVINKDVELTIQFYKIFRDFFIPELVIPNAQRSGVILGLIIDEVLSAKDNITREGLHRLTIANHKTGNLQFATLFLYPEIFQSLFTFVSNILPKMPCYSSGNLTLDNNSSVFQTWKGSPFTSSLVGIRFRRALSNMGISYNGTITDLRKTAATLTGIHYPEIHDIMSSFMCHSGSVHSRHYKVPISHDGLTKPFFALEKMQTYPSISNRNEDARFSLPEISEEITEICNDESSRALTTANTFPCALSNRPLVMKDFTLSLKHIIPKPIRKNPHLSCKKLERNSLFDNLDDENLFLRTFYAFIVQISRRERVLKKDVWNYAQLDTDFAPQLQKLSKLFPNSVASVIMKKVRTTGFSIASKRYSFT